MTAKKRSPVARRLEADDLLRAHRFAIATRRAGEEPRWRRDGKLFLQRDAFAIALRESAEPTITTGDS